MVWCVLAHVFAILVDLIAMGRRSADEKDLEIVLLRHELRLLQRRQPAPPRLARWEQLPLAVLAAKLAGAVAGGQGPVASEHAGGQPPDGAAVAPRPRPPQM